ncbi:MAG: hypothetical protein KAR79_03410 [Simkaniaceae bacterium]|nr:hypothetical protein [Simkaniaceae bacterium]
MLYTTYLALISQLLSQNKARINCFDKKVLVSVDPKNNRWTLSSKIFQPPSFLKESLSPGKMLRLEANRTYFVEKEEMIYLAFDSIPLKKYLHYKKYMEEFLKTLSLWEFS